MLNFQIQTERDRKEAALLAARRAKDEERKKRIFNPKIRLMGIDVEALDRQVEERRQREKEEKDITKIFHEQAKKADEVALLLEQKEKEERYKYHLAINEYRKNYQRLEDRREFDLNDPGYILKQVPCRKLDADDCNIGMAAAQKFEGEDVAGDQRRKIQHEEIRSWLEQQMKEKEIAERERKDADEAYKAAIMARDQRALELEALEKDCRRKLEQACINFNGALMNEKICETQRRAKEENEDNIADICNFLNSDLMTENRDVAQSNLGPTKKVASLYKGMTRAQEIAFKEDQKLQMQEVKVRKEQELRKEREMDNYMGGIQRTIYLLDQENLIKQKERDRKLQEENMRLAEEQINRKKFLDKLVYKNCLTDEYYDQFNRGTR